MEPSLFTHEVAARGRELHYADAYMSSVMKSMEVFVVFLFLYSLLSFEKYYQEREDYVYSQRTLLARPRGIVFFY